MNHISRILLAAALCGIGIAASAQEAKTFKTVKELPEGMVTTQELRQEQWDNWQFTYDHVMLIYGKAVDQDGKPYYLVKNSWGKGSKYKGTWYMSRDYIALNTTYIFLNRNAPPKKLRKALNK